MTVDNKMIKDDINFLEYPNWLTTRHKKVTAWTVQRDHGKYEILSPLGLPNQFDKIIVYSLLHKLYKETEFMNRSLTTSRYEIARHVFDGVHFSKQTYQRIITALKKWKAISINFEGIFYEGDTYTIRGFSIIDEYVLCPKSGQLTVRFNEAYIKQLQETKFYKLIDFEQYKRLHKDSSTRLYEILTKNFKDRGVWAINIQSLAEKLTFEKRAQARAYYPSDILRYLKPAINEINKKTDLYINFQFNKDTGICIFKKLDKPKEQFVPAIPDQKNKKKDGLNKRHMTKCLKYFAALSVEKQAAILRDIRRQPFLEFLPDQKARICAYMTQKKLWQSH